MTKILEPFKPEHTKLRSINKGERNIICSTERLGHLGEGQDLKSLAFELHECELLAIASNRSPLHQMIEISQPTAVDDHWVIYYSLTPLGQEVLKALDSGVWWNMDGNQICVTSTEEFYDRMLQRGVLEKTYAELLSQNTYPEFKGLVGRAVYFKLSANMDRNGNHVKYG